MLDVATWPGHPVAWYARRVGPHGSKRYGYQTVQRAIAAGRLVRQPLPRNGWNTLVLPDDPA